ncbi:MAG: 2-amino-4-hydroxy-6-hydroxymethyldihydropteridine diphosphokinase, partial [Opitutales bacterium]|nr:2-amino-4-hydroxy-6-hydroxymethyldihydropteridine diphosphokinase [Opitutales bacterium]
MVEVYLSIGSNIGDRAGYLKNGVAALSSHEEVAVKRVSPVYRTSPVGLVEQSDFFNAIVELETSMRPERLLDILLRIERRYGRVRDKAWGPRTLDMDIILFGGENWS